MDSSLDNAQLKQYLNTLDKIESAAVTAKHQASFRNDMSSSLQAVDKITMLLADLIDICEEV